jgi:opacity protein-like surface antigen
MRSHCALIVCLLALAAPTVASADGGATVGGFGGVSISSLESQRPSLGGTFTVDFIPELQIVGEVGRIGSVLPSRAGTIFSIADTGLRASAFYGEGGIRLIAAPHSSVTPYGEATAGFARLDVSDNRLGGLGNYATALALGFVGRTMPVASLGGGVLLRGGPVVFDLGYRYKQLFADQVIQDALGLGEPLRAHEVRAGIGVRF